MENGGRLIFHEVVGEPGKVSGVEVGLGLEVDVAGEEAIGRDGAAGFERAGGHFGAGVVFGLGEAGAVGALDEDAGVDKADLGLQTVKAEAEGGRAAHEARLASLLQTVRTARFEFCLARWRSFMGWLCGGVGALRQRRKAEGG